MKRFHVHAHVNDLPTSIAFYSKMFATEPTRIEEGYAKWMLEDPRVNFAISTRGAAAGIDHLGIQADDDEELAELKARAKAADLSLLDEGRTTCCYARSEKHWVTDRRASLGSTSAPSATFPSSARRSRWRPAMRTPPVARRRRPRGGWSKPRSPEVRRAAEFQRERSHRCDRQTPVVSE